MRTLEVHMNGRLVGLLDGSDRRVLRFTYDSDYAADPTATPLSVSMPLATTAYQHGKVNPYLWGLLPDNDHVIRRWASEFGCSANDVVGLLVGVGTDVAGAAQYIQPGTEPEAAQPETVEWVDEAAVAQFLRDVQRDATAWRPHPAGRWSLAGAQSKIALWFDDTSGRWGVPSGRTPTTHILKPAIQTLADFDINEHLCLAAARNLNLLAAQTAIRTFDGVRVLVVKRYDRILQPDHTLRRVHQEDLCQALSVHPALKYESDGGPSVAAMAKLVREVADDESAQRLFDGLAFNWLLAAPDAHAKNYSLLLSGAQVRLSPLYDVASGLPHCNVRRLKLAQKIDTENRPLRVRARHWQRVAISFGIKPDVAIERVDSMIDRIPDAFAEAVESSGLAPDEKRVAGDIADLVVDWSNTCRKTLADTTT